MQTFTIKMTVEIVATSQEEALLRFRDEYLDWRLPSTEVEIAPVPEDRWRDLSPSDIKLVSTPPRRWVYRSNEHSSFQKALNDGAVYRLPDNVETFKANAMLQVAEKCIGSNAGMVVKEW